MIYGHETPVRWRAFGWLRRGSAARAGRSEPNFNALVPLLEFLAPTLPPAGLLARIENRIEMIERARSTAEARAVRTRVAWRMLGIALAGALAGAATMAAVRLVGSAGIRPGGETVPLAVMASADGSWLLRIKAIADGRHLLINYTGPRIAADRALELWVIPGGEGVPRSLGLLAAKGNVTILPRVFKFGAGDMLALSEEPAGGSPVAGPTGAVLISAVVGPTG